MSDSQKQHRSGATPIKNPLLSASVTGLTFDDFPNKPLLLPAAPPILHSPATVPVAISSGLGSREPKSLVTVGSSLLDTENLDEINLNASSDDNQTSNISDPNANPLLEESNKGTKADSILSQAASSFSALPSVASNVFSTFSKRLTAISSRETTPVSDQYQQDYNSNAITPQLDIQPSYIQQSQQEGAYSQIPPTFYAPPLAGNPLSSNFDATQTNLPAVEPPKFYTPAEVPPIPSISTAPPPTSGGQNNFRFSSKKKLYAPIPGLSEQSQIPTATASVNTQTPYLTSEAQKIVVRVEELSLLSKTGDLSSALVSQSAEGSLTQISKTNTSSQPVFDQQKNFFPTAPSATNYFVPQPQTNTTYPARVAEPITTPYLTSEAPKVETEIHSISLLSKLGNFAPSTTLQNTTTSPPVFDQQNNNLPAPPPTKNFFVPQQQTNTAYPPTAADVQSKSAFSGQQAGTSQLINPQQANQTQPQTQIPLFKPSIIQSQFIPGDIAGQSSLQALPPQRPPSNLSGSQQSLTGQLATEQIAFLDLTNYLPPSNQTSVISQSNSATSALPPSSIYKVPPPKSGQTSYRLQKGTKLYKSPLAPQETALNPVSPNQIQSVPLVASPIGGGPLSVPSQTSAAGFFTPSPSFKITPLTNLPSQNVSLFTPFVEETSKSVTPVSSQTNLPLSVSPPSSTISGLDTSLKEQEPNEILQSISPATNQTSVSLSVPLPPPPSNTSNPVVPFSVPKVEEALKSNETLQGDSLLAPSNNLVQSISPKAPQEEKPDTKAEEKTSAPPIKKLKSDESALDVLSVGELETKDEQKRKVITDNEDPLETFEKHFLAQVSRQHLNPDIADNPETQSIFEPIEPVFEPNITAVKEGISVDPLEETLQKLSITAEEKKAVKLPPIGESFHLTNPYRKGSNTEIAKPAPILPTLANFFTPEPSVAAGSVNLNFFSSLPPTQSSNSNEVNFFSLSGPVNESNKDNPETIKKPEQADPINFFTKSFSSELAPLEPQTSVQPPISAFFPTGSAPAIVEDTNFLKENLPPPRDFENIKPLKPSTVILPDNTAELPAHPTIQQENLIQTQQPEVVNRFSIFFNQTNQQPEIAKDSSTFFDSIPDPQQEQQEQQLAVTVPSSIAANEEQRIQYFFNNPPPKDASNVGDLNYDLVHSGLGIRNLQQRSLTPISNLVEPPSSACSEFSEIGNSTTGQKSIAANLSITEISDNSFEAQESNKRVTEESVSVALESNVKRYEELPEEIIKELRMANLLASDKTSTSPVASVSYKPAVKHWFFKRTINDKQIWMPFSHYDSALLETSLLMEGDEKSNIVAVEGSRYDVNISERKKTSVYWESPPIEVRRCSWFYKAVDSKYVPYEEQTAEVLENEYKQAAESGVWHKTIVLGMGEQVVFHGPTVIVHFQQQQNSDAWGGTTQTATRPRVVKRDLDDFNIEEGESQKVDHLLFMVHGIGSACDLKLRSVEEVVEDFRTIARQLVQSHYKNSADLGLVGRVEVLPISWHSHLHSVEMGIDEKLRMITLESIPKLRNFTNDTLLDILFYTSPTFCQKIMNTIVSSLNALYLKYRERHPEFNGGVSLAGHSLGSLILFDLLCHQNPIKESEEKNLENPDQFLAQMDSNQLEDKQMSYTMGPAGTGQPFINYNQLIFQPKKFFALGSPIGMFVTIRGIDKLGLDFRLPTCPGFYNIFHPYDPVAYRIEALVNPDLSGIRPVLIPHHKGRKRMHLELKETMARVSMDLKNRFLDKFKTTLDSVNIFASSSKSTKEAEEMMEKEVDKVIQMQMQLEQQNHNANLPSGSDDSAIKLRQRTDSVSTAVSDDAIEIDFPLGKLNDSKRIDYVLQEAPLEFINEYIFALSSHVCYWDSEDTILFVMKEIYSGLGISPDSQVPQQTMTIERPSSRNSLIS